MRAKISMKKIIISIVIIGITAFYIFPLIIIVTNSFMTQDEINRNYSVEYTDFDYQQKNDVHYAEYKLIPHIVSLEQYKALLLETPSYLELFMNSVKITIPAVLGQIIVGTLAAYGFVISKFRCKEALFCIYIIVMVLPFQTTLVPNYYMINKLGIMDTHVAIILPTVFHPFAVFIMRQNMKLIPSEVFQAAKMDGANQLQIFFHIALPMVKGGIASLFILSFIDCWGMVEQPMIFLQDAKKEPLSVFLSTISGNNTGLIFAASFFYMIPAVLIFIFGQEYFEQGVKLSALK